MKYGACFSAAALVSLIGCVAAAEPDDAAILAAGEQAFQKCYACHALEPGMNDLTGPTLHGIVGRQVAAESGFDYSPALRAFAERNSTWKRELLDRFIADPEALVPGTSMTFHGIAGANERQALLAYLERRQGPG